MGFAGVGRMPTRISVVDQIVVAAYFVGITLFGAYYIRRTRTSEEFMVAGRRIPGWAIALSIIGSFVSNITFIAYPGKAYEANWEPFVFSLTLPLAGFVAVRWFIPLYRRVGGISAYEYLERRFGPWARIYGSLCFIAVSLLRVGMILFLLSLLLEPLLGWSPQAIVLATGVAVIVYTVLGGMEAVIWTDVVQVVILVGGAIVSLAILLLGMPEGPAQIFEIAARDGKFALGTWDLDLATRTAWVILMFGIIENLRNFGVDQNYVQRYHTARDERSAARSVWTAALVYIPVSALFLLLGTALYAYYGARPGLLPAEIASAQAGDRVFPHFIATALPPGVCGLLVAAVFAAAMSSVDSSLTCASTVTVLDFYKRHIRRGAADRECLGVVRACTIIWGILGTAVGLGTIGLGKSALDRWWIWSGVAGGGVIGLFILGLCARRARSWMAVTAVVAGSAAIAWATFARDLGDGWTWLECRWDAQLISVIGTVVLLIAGGGLALGSALRPRGHP